MTWTCSDALATWFSGMIWCVESLIIATSCIVNSTVSASFWFTRQERILQFWARAGKLDSRFAGWQVNRAENMISKGDHIDVSRLTRRWENIAYYNLGIRKACHSRVQYGFRLTKIVDTPVVRQIISSSVNDVYDSIIARRRSEISIRVGRKII